MNQDDFRRLLATPQPIKKNNNKFKAPKKENSFSKNDLSKSKPKKKWKKPINEEVDKHYRDRAKERRQEMNPDYEETKAIFSMLNKNSDVEINEKTLTYEQSKYLGGDESHTHLVKGLDYAFLKKVRKELEMKKIQEKKDNEAKAYVEQIHGDIQKPTFNSILAKNIHYWAVEKPKEQLPLKNEMFIAGRMAFVWELGLENGFYVGSSDIPITLQRSKAEIKNYQDKFDVSTNDLVIDKISQIMVNVRLGIRNVQNPSMQEKKKIKKKEKAKKIKKVEKVDTPPEDYEDIFDDVGINYKLDFEKDKKDTNNDNKEEIQKKEESNIKNNYFGSNVNNEDDKDEDDKEKDNISNMELFKGSKLLEKLMANNYDNNKDKKKKESNNNKVINNKSNENNQFEMDLDDLGNDTNNDANNNDKKLSTWQSDADIGPSRPPEEYNNDEQLNTWQSDADIGPSKPPEEYNDDEQLNTWQSNVDIGPSRPPEEYNNDEQLNTWQSNVDIGPSKPPEEYDDLETKNENYYEEYKSDINVHVPNKIKPLSKERDNDLDYSDSSDSEENNDYTQIDLGTNRNKQRQLKRWDFDTEEEWKQYKDNCVILPKAAFQYGVKLSDGRQKSMHPKSDNKSKDEKLNRELKQIEKIMDVKYRKSSPPSSSKHNDSNNHSHEHEYNRDHDHSSSSHSHSHSHSSHHHSSSKRHSRSRWDDDDDDDRHSKRNRH
ncbi:hypothetical protein BCR32DRAFT_292430 [Anaeromyces robustus]|uniref:RED-like N-terminal domain-containing protein n=1 Tax=Anaeromyces robustus TaxID=1754192 RepID=A0A1Y1XAK5_9FUNG|nr:hypothetical protein BCR32DRAFT_292430 [Anaeromyces robustus]|eukprot:ORX82785.1 hypothetical protein BCR32DRAFT_292430 [Anaeromyces robustus]